MESGRFWEIVLITLNDSPTQQVGLFCWASLLEKADFDWQEGS
jgi:hypothetical protein